jgi:uncharacterized protein
VTVADPGGRVVGRVVGLWRYPVKSMAGQSIEQADVSWHGVDGDRRWAFIREGQVRNGFPWLTIRERPDLGSYQPVFDDPDRPNMSRTRILTPAGNTFDITDPVLAAELGEGLRVLKQDRGIYDVLPLSLITTQTVAAIGAMAGLDSDVRRFRPNLLVEADGDAPFQEDDWVGAVLEVGGAWMRVDQKDRRCVLINVDPETAQRSPEMLRTVARQRRGMLGVYSSTVRPGPVLLGDTVAVLPSQ